MFITKKHISRARSSGHGSSSSTAISGSDGAGADTAEETAASPKNRLTCIEVVHGDAGSTEYGTNEHLWIPAKEGSDFDFTPILKPLETFREHVTVVSMMDCRMAEPFSPEEVGADHFRSAAVFLTASHPKQTHGSDIYCGTVDRSDVCA